ncbi:hypothetical protein ACFFWB_27415 [Flavobacterium procerum]
MKMLFFTAIKEPQTKWIVYHDAFRIGFFNVASGTNTNKFIQT